MTTESREIELVRTSDTTWEAPLGPITLKAGVTYEVGFNQNNGNLIIRPVEDDPYEDECFSSPD